MREFLRDRIGNCLRDERLATAGRAIQQHSFGRPQFVLLEQFRMKHGQLHGVLDLLDLIMESADVGVFNIRHFLQD